jgi:hypothetical protein
LRLDAFEVDEEFVAGDEEDDPLTLTVPLKWKPT